MAEKPLIAYREWGVEGDPLTLAPRHRSYSRNVNPWERMEKVSAYCANDHEPGTEGCECGLYGYYDIPSNYSEPIFDHVYTDTARRITDSTFVFGAYIGWGTTSKHRKGLRSQYARCVALRWSPAAELIAKEWPWIVIADTPGELRAAALAAGGELFDPKTLPDDGKGVQGWARSRALTTPPIRAAVSQYRSPEEQKRLWALHNGGPARQVTCTVVLGKGAGVQIEEGLEKFQKRMTITGLDDKVWTVRTICERVDRVDVALAGTSRMAMKIGARMIEIEIEAVLPDSALDYELAQLTKIGTIFKTDAVPHQGPLPRQPNHGLPGTSNHSMPGGPISGFGPLE